MNKIKIPSEEKFQYSKGSQKLLGILLLVGIAGLLLSLVGGFIDQKQFAFSWLYSFMCFFTLCAGSLFWVFLHHATNAGWSVGVRRQLENVASLFPFVALFFIPVVICAPFIYEWMNGAHLEHDPLWQGKRPFLNPFFFWIRTLIYFSFFIFASWLLKTLSTRQDSSGDSRLSLTMRKISYGFIPLFAFSLTFAVIDWLMTLDFHWFSTIWGVYFFSGSVWASMALLILIITALKRLGYLEEVVTLEHYHIMGKLLFAFTVFWAYIAFSQYFLIWYANIPEETSFFFHRTEGSWSLYSLFLIVIGHFVVPFILLLTQWIKRKPALLCGVCVWVLLVHFADMYWIVMPELHETNVSIQWLDFTTLIGMGSLLAFFFIRFLGNQNLYATRDPRLEESVHVKN